MKPPKKSRNALSDTALAQIGFVVLTLAVLCNLGTLWMAERSYDELRLASAAVEQTQRVGNAIDRLRIDLLDAEDGQRGFIVTSDPIYLAPYQEALRRLSGDLDGLGQMIVGNPVQADQLATVRRLVNERVREIRTTLDLRRSDGFEAAQSVVLTHAGKITMDIIRAALDGMMEEESRVRGERIGGLAQHQHAIELGFFAEASLNLLLVTLGALFLWGELRRHRREREILEQRRSTLEREVRDRTAQLTELSRFQESVREDERKRVARELHDELGGTLTAAKIDLQLISDRLKTDAIVVPRIARISAALDDAIAVKRRIIEDLRPTLLDNLGISAALRWQCEEFAKRTGCTCTPVMPELDEQPSPEQSVAIYRIVQEALTNIAKYAEATRVAVELLRKGNLWHLRVRDDGIGIDPEKQHHPTSHGLISIRERVHALGGEVSVKGDPDAGTSIEVSLPVIQAEAGATQ